MKAKRVLLHISILVLAVVCMCAGTYICYYEIKGYYQDQEYYYNYEYHGDVDEILDYADVEMELRKKYNKPDKVVLEDSKHGNVTVEDIEEIFIDKYQHYYKNGNYINYNDFDDYMESSDGNEGTLYKEDYNLMKTFRKKWKENPTNTSNKESYLYYKNKCRAVDKYAKLIDYLLRGRCYNGENIKLSDTNTLIKKSYPLASDGFAYYVEYTLQGEKYTVSNVDDKNFFALEGVVDITQKRKNLLVQDNPLYGTKELDKLGDSTREFIKNANEIYFAIDTSMESNYTYYMERIKNQLTDEEIEQLKQREVVCIITIIITLVIALVLFIWLMFMAGHKEKEDKASLYKVDKVWLDIIIAILAVIIGCELAVFIDALEGDYGNNVEKIIIISLMILFILDVEAIVLASESFMRRIKSKALMDTTLIGRIIKVIINIVKRIKSILMRLWSNIHLTWKVVILGIIFITFEMINSYVSYYYGLEGVIVQVPLVTLLVCGLVWLYFDENKKIKEGARKIAQGDIDYKIEEKMKFSVNEELKESVNSIGDGLNGAVLESIKNERMKTELIANVSHDLKTPLTSIINYVDLLKNEGLDSQNAAKYLDVLDKKSQRLKHLTEDLVEVSKLNSGAVSLQLEKIDIVQLVKQSLGEYAEKFKERKLQIIKTIQQEPIYVMADGSKTWRLFENLYQNVYKYAMPGTRVYIEIKQENGKAVVSVKNISEGPLNFSADELMERFVRGDVSRTTEGSGLGLSIARSIADRQNGSMNIVLDGDLFKVEVMINLINQ